jgi:hypothetical protein
MKVPVTVITGARTCMAGCVPSCRRQGGSAAHSGRVVYASSNIDAAVSAATVVVVQRW